MTKREFQKAEYEAEVTGEMIPKQISGSCRTCHWWHWGDCVLHTGLRGRTAAKMDFGGVLKTKADFGCSEWRKDERPNKD